uniref:Uncharacterized protein n=1 Tax=Aegilops tauschii subsp. strangulata TaxID=200361 RepID=A0A453M2H1_AEGTS
SRLRRLLVRVSASERLAVAGDGKEREKEERPAAGGEAEVGSVGLDRMVLSFMEDSAAVERPPRGRCNCFNGSNYEESDDEEGFFLPSGQASAPPPSAAGDTLEALKGLVQSASVAERNLLADASRIAERCGRTCKGKAECRRAVADGLRALGYDAAVCKSRWEKTKSYPAGTKSIPSSSIHIRSVYIPLSWHGRGLIDPLRLRRGARVHRRRGWGRREADRGGALQVRVRGGPVDQGVPRGAPGAAAAVRGHVRPAREDRVRGGGGGAAEHEEEGAALPTMA